MAETRQRPGEWIGTGAERWIATSRIRSTARKRFAPTSSLLTSGGCS